ncbi:MAG: mechanosensitive ion channel family protein [Chlamydiales bacterium]|nr:mechanosensitive ion channel family protein [Chlamydiales bacterium]
MFQSALCFCLPYLINLAIIAALFIAAYAAYRIVLFGFRRLTKNGLFRAVIEKLRLPALILAFELALFFSIFLIGFTDKIENFAYRLTLVLFVITIGWFVMRAVRASFRHVIDIFSNDPHRKSSVIQLLFVYRMILLAVTVLTIAGVLLMFPTAKHVGVGLLGSAGVAGLVIGMAARPIFLNLMAGFQIAITKTINLNDGVIVEGDFGRVESIHLTYVVVRTWDMRRHVIPISQFIDKPFQNTDLVSTEKIGTVFLYCDYHVPVDALRQKFDELLKSTPLYNGNVSKFHVVEMTEQCMKIRLLATANDRPLSFELQCYIRENMVKFLREEYPNSLPRVREIQCQESV